MKNNEIDIIRNIAIDIESTNILHSYDLINLIKEHRPNGKVITSKYYEYKNKIDVKTKEIREKVDKFLQEECQSKENTIWLYWDSSLDNAPEIVKKSVNTWLIKNQDYNVELLDNDKLDDLLGFNLEDLKYLNVQVKLGKAGLTDILRLILLYKFGGVWADATTFCHKSLSEWLNLNEGEFFTFKQPESIPDRTMVSWFMATKQKNHLVGKLLDKCLSFIKRERKKPVTLIHHIIINQETRRMIGNQQTGYEYLDYCDMKNRIPYFWMFYLWNEIEKENLNKKNDPKRKSYWQENVFNIENINDIYVSKNTYRPSQNMRIAEIKYKYISEESMLDTPYGWKKIASNAQISEKHKVAFVHVPKAGGTSIDNSNIFDGECSGHSNYKKLNILLGNRKNDFKFFTLVRNPWDRLASAFYYLSEGGSNKYDNHIKTKFLDPFNGDFQSFLLDFISNPNIYLRHLHFKEMYRFIDPNDVKQELLVKKLEDINDLSDIQKYVGFDFTLQHERKRKSYSNVRKIYTEFTFNEIKKIFEKDIALFGYDDYTLDDVKN